MPINNSLDSGQVNRVSSRSPILFTIRQTWGWAMLKSTPLVGQLFNLVIRDYRMNGQSSLVNVIHQLKHLEPVFASDIADAVKASKVEAYKESRLAEDAKPATINRELATLKRAYSLGLREEVIRRRPSITMLKEDNVRMVFIEHDAYLKLYDALPDYVKPLLYNGYHTGWRKQEVLGLEKSWIEREQKLIRLPASKSKNRKFRKIILDHPYFDEFWVMIDKWAASTPPDFPYVYHSKGQKIRSYRRAWEGALKRAGILEHKVPHDMRKSAIRNMLRAGVPAHTAMQVSGHKIMSTFFRYDIVNEDDIREAMQKVGDYLSKKESRVPFPAAILANSSGMVGVSLPTGNRVSPLRGSGGSNPPLSATSDIRFLPSCFQFSQSKFFRNIQIWLIHVWIWLGVR